MKLESIKYGIQKLSIKEKKDLIDFIKGSYSLFDGYSTCVKGCPVCQSSRIVKNGTRKGVQKYVCRHCEKNFNYKTNSVLAKIQKLNKWNEFVEDFTSLNITSLKAMSQKLQVSQQTAFNWRHKLLSAMIPKAEVIFKNEAIEFDETWLRLSRKARRGLGIKDKSAYRKWRRKQTGDSNYNVKVFFTYGRDSRQLDTHQSHTGRTSVVDMENYFVRDKFKDVTVFSDAHYTYKSFFRDNNIRHETFIAKNHVSFSDKNVHNQTVNAFTRGFKFFVNEHLRGVSSKYLSFYVKWFQFIQASKVQVLKKEELKFNLVDEICDNVIQDKLGIELYRQAEVSFGRFLKNNGRTNHGNCKHHYYADKMAA